MRQIRDPKSRARIVETAWRVVAEHGLRDATMRAIASEAGVSTGSVTHYFTGKGELVAEVLALNNVRAASRVQAAARSHRGLAAVEAAVDALMPLDAESRREWLVWMAFWSEAALAGDNGTKQALRSASAALEKMVASLLRGAGERDELPAGLDLDYEAYRLVTLIAGIGLRAGAEPMARVRRAARTMLSEHLECLRLEGKVGAHG